MAPDYPARIGSYHVLGVLGDHRLGPVYRAYDEAQSRVVALRVWAPDVVADAPAMDRMRREGKALATLAHKNIVTVLDIGRDADLHYTASEYVDGGSLAGRLRGARPTVAEALHLVCEVAAGVSAAHSHGIVHGDLASRHVLVSRDLSVVKVADFGITTPPEVSIAAQTMTGARLGSMLYRAPELLAGTTQPDARSDLYSLGVIAYEALTGRMPIGKFGLPSDLNPQVPLALDPIVLKCLASDPAQRYQTVSALLADLDTLRDVRDYQVMSELNQLTGGRLFKSPGRTLLSRGTSRTPLYLGAAVTLLVVAGVAATAYLRSGEAAPSAGASAGVTPSPASPANPAAPPAAPVQPTTPAAATTSLRAAPAPPASSATAPPVAPAPAAAPRPSTPPARPANAAAKAAPRGTGAVVGGTGPAKSAATVDVNAAAGALFNEAQALIAAKNTVEARRRLEGIGTSYAESTWFVPAMSAKIALEDREKVKEFDPIVGASVPASLLSRRRLVERAPQHPSAEGALWWLAEAYDDMKKYPLAAETYASLGASFPNTKLDAWFKAAELYERRLNQKDEARAAYLKVPPTSSHYKDAQNRSQKLQNR